MKRLFIALTATVLFASCSKKESTIPASTNPEVQQENVRRGPPWDVVNATYVQSSRRPTATVTFGTTWSGTTGTGDIYVAACNSSGTITSGWNGLYGANNYSATFNPGLMYITGGKVAVLFYPGVPGHSASYPPASQIGYTVNTYSNDGMDLATVQTQ